MTPDNAEAVLAASFPSGWQDAVRRDGSVSFNLADRGIRAEDAGALLAAAGRRLAATGPGFEVGPVRVITETAGSPYAALTSGPVPYHNDHLYFVKMPQYVMFSCERPADEGGRTFVIRGDDALRHLPPSVRVRFEGMRVRVRQGDCSIRRPLIDRHPLDGTDVFLFADTVADELCIVRPDDRPLAPDVLADIRATFAACPTLTIDWRVGDVLILDNYKTLHAREAFRGERRLLRVSVGPFASRET